MGKNGDKNNHKIKRNIAKDTKDTKDKETSDNKENINIENNTTNNNKRNKKIYIGVACCCIFVGVMYFCSKRYDDLVYPNIKLYDNNVSGINDQELKNKVDDTINFIKENTISVNIGDKKYEIKTGDLVSTFNSDEIENDIISFGKNQSFIEQFGLITLSVKRNYNFKVKVDYNEIKDRVDEIYEDSTIDVVEPTVTIKNEKITVKEGKNGKAIDKNKLSNEIIDAIEGNDIGKSKIALNGSYKTIKPKTDIRELNKIESKISSATTYFGGTGYNRGKNIANATNLINNTLLMPGEEFSYEEAVSPVELNNGYYMAPVIVNGTHEDAPGGGVCQVSSTLYNTQLKAGIISTERYNHSKSVSYVKKGLDATLATGSKDLKFKNTYDYPILIHAYTIGGQITVEFWSKKGLLEGKEYTPVSFVKGNVANAYLYEYNSKGELIEKKFIDTSIYG